MIDYSFMNGAAQPPAPNAQQQPAKFPGSNVGPMASIPGSAVTTQNSGAIADAMTSGATDPVATGNTNAGGYMDKLGGKSGASFMLASIGQALSAKDPSSWQHQMSTGVKQGAQAQMQQRGMLIAALQQKMGASPDIKLGPLAKAKTKYSLGGTKLDTLPSGFQMADFLNGGV